MFKSIKTESSLYLSKHVSPKKNLCRFSNLIKIISFNLNKKNKSASHFTTVLRNTQRYLYVNFIILLHICYAYNDNVQAMAYTKAISLAPSTHLIDRRHGTRSLTLSPLNNPISHSQ